MNYYDKLNLALKYLSENQVGSFIYYKEMPEKVFIDTDRNYSETPTIEKDKIDRDSRLIKYFKDKNIPDKEHLPIIDQLIRDGFVDAFYSIEKPKELGHLPHKIKITYTGIRFINELSGYNSLQPSYWNKHKDLWLVIISGFIGISGTVLGILLTKCSE